MHTSRQFLKTILPKVSRTFALNIKILRNWEYDFIASVYCICRFIDTIEDSNLLSSTKKVDLLKKFSQIFSTKYHINDFSNLIQQCHQISNQFYENELIRNFKEILYLYSSLPQTYQDISKDKIVEMADGMAFFTKKYSRKKRKIFNQYEELEKYCYYVAGTVGIILTRFFSLKIHSPSRKKLLEEKTIAFGLALQMTNIIKDFQNDKKRGWVYIPNSMLKKAGISIEDFYNKINEEQFKKIQDIFIQKIEHLIDHSIKYILSIPIYLYRYRIFCLIPLFLSIKTVYFLKKRTLISIKKNKISKIDMFITISTIYFIFFSNFLIKKYYCFIKRKK